MFFLFGKRGGKSGTFRDALPHFCFIFLFFLFNGLFMARLFAQESILSSYERNFIRASLAAKTGILADAATDDRAGEFIGDLYEFALQFALVNGDYLKNDPDMIALVAAAAKGAGTGGNTASVKSLWNLFRMFPDSYSRVEILGALGNLGTGNGELAGNLNRLLADQTDSWRAGLNPDYPVLGACIAALGALGDSSSFPFLFSAITAGYPQTVTQEILRALESIQGDYKDYLLGVIRNNPFPEKAVAFRIGAYNEKLTPAERGELAQTALQVALDSSGNTGGNNIGNTGGNTTGNSGPMEAALRYDAVTVLTRLQWTPASPLAIRNFYQVQNDYSGGAIPRERLLEAIACLGVMGSSDAAQALALQLGYINSRFESTGDYDEVIVLAYINALGELGDKSAFDYLLYISYLNYPDKIQAAAREALNRLKW